MQKRSRRWLATGAALATVAGVALAGATAPAPAQAAPDGAKAHNVITEDFPDPGFAVFNTRTLGTKYYLYSTGAGFRVASSTRPDKGFDIHGDSMSTRPVWTYETTDEPKPELWAPHVFQTASDVPERERFTMYFAARREAPGKATDGKHCIGAAQSSSPLGGFVPAAKPLICPPKGYSEAIDPSVYTTTNGNRYLIYKIGNYTPRRFKIMAVQVDDAAGTTKQGKPKVVLDTAQIGSAVAEAPDVYRDPDGRVHLFVSRNGYTSCEYATQVWSGSSLFALGDPRWVGGMSPTDGFCGPGGAEVLQDGKKLRVAFHASKTLDPLVRYAWTGVIKWRDGDPYLT